MASRALLQRIPNRGALRLSPGVSVPLALILPSSFGTRAKVNNGILCNTNVNNIRSSMNRHQKLSSTSSKANKELATMSEEELSGLKVREERLMKDLHETCEWGKGEVWGR
jgi:hypothetical protein